MTIWEKVIQAKGPRNQKIKAMEEMSELIQALSKDLTEKPNAENIAEEMADVAIMWLQLLLIYNNAEQVLRYLLLKQERLQHRLEKGGDAGGL